MMFGKFFKKRQKRTFDLTPEQDELLGSAVEEYNDSLKSINEALNFNGFDEWAYDQYSNKFHLKNNDGIIIEADAQIIGSYSARDKSWEWAWYNPNIEDDAKKSSKSVVEYGEKEGIEYLSEGIVPVLDDVQATYFAAVGMKLSNSQAIYPADAGNGITVFLMLKDITRKGT